MSVVAEGVSCRTRCGRGGRGGVAEQWRSDKEKNRVSPSKSQQSFVAGLSLAFSFSASSSIHHTTHVQDAYLQEGPYPPRAQESRGRRHSCSRQPQWNSQESPQGNLYLRLLQERVGESALPTQRAPQATATLEALLLTQDNLDQLQSCYP